jgi:hypothetical protein
MSLERLTETQPVCAGAARLDEVRQRGSDDAEAIRAGSA